MKAYFLLTVWLVLSSSSFAQFPYTQEKVIAYAKSVNVHMLDPLLPVQTLEDWLETGPPHAHIWSWIVADTCDLKPDDPNVDYPLCAKVKFGRNGENGEFLVQVGTNRSGIGGAPKLYYGVGVYEAAFVRTGGSERLSDLPGLLDQPVIAGGVQKLYSEIALRHPIGIPVGPEMAAIRPFVSERLADQLRSARACQDDYMRQRTTVGQASKPGWTRSGLFSGKGRSRLAYGGSRGI